MEFRRHCKSTMMILGKQHREVHMTMDSYFSKFRHSIHWVILHHQLGVEKIVERFGEGARRAAEIHIEDDVGFMPDGPTDPRLLKYVQFFGPRDLELADGILEGLYGEFFNVEAAWEDVHQK